MSGVLVSLVLLVVPGWYRDQTLDKTGHVCSQKPWTIRIR